ncbi:MAG: DNA gyrase subunit A [Deltaproteobacteria bacterium]|nr:DNA gyrase subunit A [Deltaproteobacteria bacterium]
MYQDDNKVPVYIEDEMKTAYLDYAMSVIVGRALPDVRDGLKPVHRRILFAMHDLGNVWNKPYKKSARVVGDVIGKYHPHGDTAVYDAIVRMAQDFSLRYPLVDGQGNFGSIDGDSAAAMRYTEVRMDKLTAELLEDLEKETVEFVPNYDGSLQEPSVLPAKVPALLINGSSGIAVGMATNIPPHNLAEVIKGIITMIENPDITIDELIEIIPGPDFPTAGFIHGREGIRSAYETGRGIVQMRARVLVEKQKRTERESIIVTELPYQVNKAKLIEKIAELVRDKKIEGISDLRDESDRDGMRIVIELKRDEVAQVIINALYKNTQMQQSFGVNTVALVNGQPRLINLRELLWYFIDHRKEVVTRRTIFELKKAEDKAHILEGLAVALANIDRIIEIIKRSPNSAEASKRLVHEKWEAAPVKAMLKKAGFSDDELAARFTSGAYGLSEVQAKAILEMRLHRLTGLEQEKIQQDLEEVLKQIAYLKTILGDEKVLMGVIVDELKDIKARFGDERRTEIIDKTTEITLEDLIVDEDMVVTISHTGYIKRNPTVLYRAQRRGGKGKTGMSTKEEDFVEHLFIASTHSYILFFTDAGKVYWLKVHEIPQAGRAARGKAIVNLLNIANDENITSFLPVRNFEEGRYIMMATRQGVVKKTDLMAYSNPRAGGIIAINLDEGDSLVVTRLTDGTKDIFLGTKDGQSIRFKEDQVRPMGRVSRGVRGITLAGDDILVAMEIVGDASTILTVTENGFGKRTATSEYRGQSRSGKGVITIKTTERNGKVVGFLQVTDDDEVMMITNSGKIIRFSMKGISVIGRNTQGVKLIGVEEGERVVSVARLAEREEREEDDDEEGGEESRE